MSSSQQPPPPPPPPYPRDDPTNHSDLPPTYDEAVRNRSNLGKNGEEPHQQQPVPGPSWLHHSPQQNQFDSPHTSLQYEEDLRGTASLQQRHQHHHHRHHHRYRIGPRVHVELGEDPAELVCPHCDLIVVTEVSSEAGFMAFFLSAVLCLIGCWPCALLPCCIAELMDVTHTCPNCGNYIQTHRKHI